MQALALRHVRSHVPALLRAQASLLGAALLSQVAPAFMLVSRPITHQPHEPRQSSPAVLALSLGLDRAPAAHHKHLGEGVARLSAAATGTTAGHRRAAAAAGRAGRRAGARLGIGDVERRHRLHAQLSRMRLGSVLRLVRPVEVLARDAALAARHVAPDDEVRAPCAAARRGLAAAPSRPRPQAAAHAGPLSRTHLGGSRPQHGAAWRTVAGQQSGPLDKLAAPRAQTHPERLHPATRLCVRPHALAGRAAHAPRRQALLRGVGARAAGGGAP